MRTTTEKQRKRHTRFGTPNVYESLLRGSLFVLKALILFGIAVELVLLAYVLKALLT